MPLRYLGHSAIEIQTGSQKVILIDPWLEGNPACPPHLKHPDKVDLIILTHGHQDHTGGVVELAKRTKAKVCAIWELAFLLINDGLDPDQLLMMNQGGALLHEGLTLRLTQAVHSSSYIDKKGVTHYAGEACGVVLTLESGRVIYHAGDTALFSDMKLIGELYKPEIALLPIGDSFTMGIQEASLATEWIKPKVVIPIHYNTFDAITVNADDFKKAASHLAEVIVLKPGETYSASKNSEAVY